MVKIINTPREGHTVRFTHLLKWLTRLAVYIISASALLALLLLPTLIASGSSRTALVAIVLTTLAAAVPRIFSGWSTYVRVWHATRLLVAMLLYFALYPLNVAHRYAPRIGPAWGLLTPPVVAVLLWLAATAPPSSEVDSLILDAAYFINRSPIDDRSAETATALVGRYHALQPYIDRSHPDIGVVFQAIEVCYPSKRPDTPIDQRVDGAIAALDRHPNPTAVVHILKAKACFAQSKQGTDVARIEQMRSALARVSPLDSPVSDQPSFETEIVAAYFNLSGIQKMFLGRLTATRGQYNADVDSLFARARRDFEHSSAICPTDTFNRMRQLNNCATVMFEKLRWLGSAPQHAGAAVASQPLSPLPVSFNTADRDLQKLRDDLLRYLPHDPRPEAMLTIAQVTVLFLHAEIESYCLRHRAKRVETEQLQTIQQYLRDIETFVVAAVRCGLPVSVFTDGPHELGLCAVLSSDNIAHRNYPPEVSQVLFDTRKRIADSLSRAGLNLDCPFCETRYLKEISKS